MIEYDNTKMLSIMFTMRGSIFDDVLPKMIITTIISLAASALYLHGGMFASDSGVDPISPLAFTLVGVMISFLLVFRSKVSYDRFWEGRGHLGAAMAEARNLARHIASCIRDDDGPEGVGLRDVDTGIKVATMLQPKGYGPNIGGYDKESGLPVAYTKMCGVRRMQMLRSLVIYWRLLVNHLQDRTGEEDVKKIWQNVREVAPPGECPREFAAAHRTITTPHNEFVLGRYARRPLVAVGMLTWCIRNEYRNCKLTHIDFLAMEQRLQGLIVAFNGVDKLHATPIPFPYAQMLLVLLMMFCFGAPFMFVTLGFGWFTLCPSLLLSLAFFGTNEVALQLEDPFGTDENDLPMNKMGNALKDDCDMFLQIAGVPPSNIKLYWEQIAQSATKWEEVKKLERNFLSHNRILGNASPRASNSSRGKKVSLAKDAVAGFLQSGSSAH